ncbi:MAG TPA: hypothetical protein VJM76_03055 [Gammaproteobacteria bacterium]|nr:hypothetical protein [Gammaproteobacteria bacterium]
MITQTLGALINKTSRLVEDNHDDAARGHGPGADAYLCKPVNLTQFNKVLRQPGLYWLVLNESPPGPDGLRSDANA